MYKYFKDIENKEGRLLCDVDDGRRNELVHDVFCRGINLFS
jgi:hypothetical protein